MPESAPIEWPPALRLDRLALDTARARANANEPKAGRVRFDFHTHLWPWDDYQKIVCTRGTESRLNPSRLSYLFFHLFTPPKHPNAQQPYGRRRPFRTKREEG